MAESTRRGVPEATVGRLPGYLRALTTLAEEGRVSASSEELAGRSGVRSAQVRKDQGFSAVKMNATAEMDWIGTPKAFDEVVRRVEAAQKLGEHGEQHQRRVQPGRPRHPGHRTPAPISSHRGSIPAVDLPEDGAVASTRGRDPSSSNFKSGAGLRFGRLALVVAQVAGRALVASSPLRDDCDWGLTSGPFRGAGRQRPNSASKELRASCARWYAKA